MKRAKAAHIVADTEVLLASLISIMSESLFLKVAAISE